LRITLTAVAVGLAVLLAGCGSSSHTPTRPVGTKSSIPTTTTPIATTGTAGTALATSGSYDATNSAVRGHINAALVSFFTSKGFVGVTVVCKALSSARVSCQVGGTNKKDQTSSATMTVSVNQTNGLLRIVHVTR
jgi:hypothetical protein